MPTSTFFRLPEEKRTRLIEASWDEVSQVRFSEVSINRIISAARIPRGSFYQYFEDKEDLIHYLLEDMREYFISRLGDILVEVKGDMFDLPLLAYDRLMNRQGDTDPMLELFIKVLRLNQGIDFQAFIRGPDRFLPDELWELIDPARLRRGDREYADHAFHMACAALALAVVENLCDYAGEDPRAALKVRMDLLRYGGAAEESVYKEEST